MQYVCEVSRGLVNSICAKNYTFIYFPVIMKCYTAIDKKNVLVCMIAIIFIWVERLLSIMVPAVFVNSSRAPDIKPIFGGIHFAQSLGFCVVFGIMLVFSTVFFFLRWCYQFLSWMSPWNIPPNIKCYLVYYYYHIFIDTLLCFQYIINPFLSIH